MVFKDQFGKRFEVKEEKTDIQWRVAVYGVVFDNEGKILVLKPHFYKKELQFPGGGVELNEDLETALKREFLEEVGYKIKPNLQELIYLNSGFFYDSRNDLYFNSLQLTFKAELESNERFEYMMDTDEKSDFGNFEWVLLNDLVEENFQYTHWPIVEKLRNRT